MRHPNAWLEQDDDEDPVPPPTLTEEEALLARREKMRDEKRRQRARRRLEAGVVSKRGALGAHAPDEEGRPCVCYDCLWGPPTPEHRQGCPCSVCQGEGFEIGAEYAPTVYRRPPKAA